MSCFARRRRYVRPLTKDVSMGRCLPVLLGAILLVSEAMAPAAHGAPRDEIVSLDGAWRFRLDPKDTGEKEGWFKTSHDRSSWRTVRVPHTWQVEPGSQDYHGAAWYARTIAPDAAWKAKALRVEFDAVYRDVRVWINGRLLGEHTGSGWTPFHFSLNGRLKLDQPNLIVVRVDNRFSENALPYRNSFDWAADGGIIRSVRLRVSPPTRLTRIQVEAVPKPDFSAATIEIGYFGEGGRAGMKFVARLFGPGGGLVREASGPVKPKAGGRFAATARCTIPRPVLWHFDHPNLYRAVCRLVNEEGVLYEREVTFGIRRVEVRDGRYWLNGEPMRLMGVEWMPGSDPRYGMAEPHEVERRILEDMKRLNCVLTRFHWQQDDFVFRFCDRNGMLVQEEIPAWGGRTMRGKLDDVQDMQTREMITAHYNHPSIYAWGLCNEIGGQSKEAHRFVTRGRDLARGLDPARLLTYASNSLRRNPGRCASGLLDFIEWNEYYGSWYRGSSADVGANLKRIHDAFPDKSVVISEYGLCECSPRNPSGDARRIEILRNHTGEFRKAPWVAGAIFFDYNDYRTHIGDKGQGEFRQRVHGVVDLFGRPKASWQALRQEASPIRTLRVLDVHSGTTTTQARVEIVTRSLENDLPAYTLRGYELVWIAYNEKDQPIGTGRRVLADLPPGSRRVETIKWPTFARLARVKVEVFRPTGYSVLGTEWQAKKP